MRGEGGGEGEVSEGDGEGERVWCACARTTRALAMSTRSHYALARNAHAFVTRTCSQCTRAHDTRALARSLDTLLVDRGGVPSSYSHLVTRDPPRLCIAS